MADGVALLGTIVVVRVGVGVDGAVRVDVGVVVSLGVLVDVGARVDVLDDVRVAEGIPVSVRVGVRDGVPGRPVELGVGVDTISVAVSLGVDVTVGA